MAASLKISELNELTALADQDLFLVTDTSATTSKKVSYSTLKTGFGSDAATVLGITPGDTSMGAFSGSAVGDNLTVKQIFQALANKIDAKQSVLGVTSEVSHLGTFTGSTIADDQDIKTALQSLETATELRATSASPSFTGTAGFGGDVDFNSGGMFFKQSNNRLGIGTTSPGGGLHISHGSVNAVFQRAGGSSKLNIKPNAVDDGMTFQGVVNGPNSIRFEGYGNNIGFRFEENNAGTFTTLAHIKSGGIDLKKDTTVTGNLSITGNLSVTGTTTTVNTVTMEAANAVVFEGATADDNDTTLTIIDPDADRTIKLPNQSGCLPVLAVDSNTAITATPEELNILDGVTATAAEINYLDGVTSAIQTQLDSKLASASVPTAASLHLDDVRTALGIAAEDTNFGTFTGSTISDNSTIKAAVQALETATELRATIASPSFTGTAKHERLEVDSDGGYFLRLDRNTSTQIDIITGNIPSGGNLNIKNSNGSDAKVVVYSDLFWVRNLGGSNGNGNVRIDGTLNFNGTDLTATVAQLNVLSSVTATATEINILDGVTATTGEINRLDITTVGTV